ncbi:thioredoxin (macronuclear) [Tetrahymena thermophila SB210]|uniref:Thioredoxin n=1 Tax=Tetrahymena thermophila (strain SB210) TaxID=312017 RepID=Q22AI5_TETTS|nr:thioredoxin [Tetrahymena thermophila SB210]7TGH_TX Chain TX, Thioredoxin [Tetrahymena thermophila]8B6F_BJ Chain BJ, Thioredoxin [Tetrahymena thermophila SB210]8BQS_BJ Chain BJ, Thioredoxin [Tetrahymena thermophila SB210]8GYM_TX Chain TX, Thioredoxin [Tetrahymena thermophila SB210]8GYM_tx Chain tx, Thioredoxin [Tetrahymena thermophila SB210]8GZU_TX Chain TX, Thioredoxin [Tetrahymena thermophila SB210]8GZU_tx Chain tx, Thioredoxin [Tetrahymena thermophila SB210]EAR82289.3 thioredoxin [Tetr|eukprot:XP_001029952.3 thioredoxin [Tetrahymena thermophila SB210]
MINISKSASKVLKLNQALNAQFSRVRSFNDFKAAKTYIDTLKPKLACLYFRADWNPLCEQADKDFDKLSDTHLEYEFVKIDIDKAPQAKGYFAVRCEPEFLLLCLGQEMTRQTGQNQRNLEHRLFKVQEYVKGLNFPAGMDTYEEFHEQYMAEHTQLDKEINEWAR